MIKKNILSFLLFASLLMQAQEPVSINLSEKNGVPDKEFYDIIEDDKGFIWLSADKGLFRYDGKLYKKYINKQQRGQSVFGVKQDNLGRIWCNNISGQFFYTENEKLHLFADLSKILKGELAEFIIKGNYLWVISSKNIYKIELNTISVEKCFNKEQSFGTPYGFDNTIYISNRDSILSLDLKSDFKKSLVSNLLVKKNLLKSQGKTKIFKVDTSFFLLERRNDKNTFFQFNIIEKKVHKKKEFKNLSKERVYNLFNEKNEIWVGTDSGVWMYEFRSNRFYLKKRILKDKKVTKIIKDKEDNYWLTTLNNGIYVIPNINIEVSSISEKNKNISSLDVVNDSTLVFGTKNGNVAFYNIINHIEKNIALSENDRVSALRYHSKKNTVFISRDLESYIYNHKTKQLQKTSGISRFNTAKSITILKNRDLLVTNYNSVIKLKNGNFNTEKTISSNKKRTYTSYYDKFKNEIYIAFVDGLVKYDSIWNPKIIQYKNTSIYSKSISGTTNGFIWISTFKNGIYGIKNDSIISHYTTINGLSSNYIRKVKADKNKLWISTENSVQVLNVLTGKFKTLTKRDGILSYDISGIEILGSKVFFSSSLGLFSLDKEKTFKVQNPKIYFNKFQVNDRDTIIASNYKLNYKQNTIKIGFNVNGFLYNQKGKYKYRLKGLNDSWFITDTGVNEVKYNSLPAGNYIFQVYPNTDNKSEKIIELRFLIKKPFWKTWWFTLGVIVFVLVSVILYFKRRMETEENKRVALLEKLSLEKELININLTALRSQMNPHFIFNALNSIQDLVLKQNVYASYDSIVLFSELIRNTLSYSSQDFISIDKELNFLKVYLQLETLRFGNEFKYTITFKTIENLEIPSLLIQPFIENALLHGLLHKKGRKELNIEFSFLNNILQCVIVDNGIGRNKSKNIANRQGSNHESFALGAIEKRLEIFKKQFNEHIGYTIEDLFDDDKAEIGTKVTVIMPYKRLF